MTILDKEKDIQPYDTTV